MLQVFLISAVSLFSFSHASRDGMPFRNMVLFCRTREVLGTGFIIEGATLAESNYRSYSNSNIKQYEMIIASFHQLDEIPIETVFLKFAYNDNWLEHIENHKLKYHSVHKVWCLYFTISDPTTQQFIESHRIPQSNINIKTFFVNAVEGVYREGLDGSDEKMYSPTYVKTSEPTYQLVATPYYRSVPFVPEADAIRFIVSPVHQNYEARFYFRYKGLVESHIGAAITYKSPDGGVKVVAIISHVTELGPDNLPYGVAVFLPGLNFDVLPTTVEAGNRYSRDTQHSAEPVPVLASSAQGSAAVVPIASSPAQGSAPPASIGVPR